MIVDRTASYDALVGAAATFAWTACREWDDRPSWRRGARLAVVAGFVPLVLLGPGGGTGRPGGDPAGPGDPADPAAPADPLHPGDAPGVAGAPRVPLALAAGGTLVALALPLAWRRVEDRWLRRLARRGHRRPAVSLGLRLAAAQAALELATAVTQQGERQGPGRQGPGRPGPARA